MAQGLFDGGDQVAAQGLGGRDVDGDLQGRKAGVHPRAPLLAGGFQCPGADLRDLAGALGDGDEVFGQDQAAIAVVPADQGLDAGDLQALAADLGLVDQLQFVVPDGVAQVVFQGQRVDGAASLAGVEVFGAVPAATLGDGQGAFGAAGELVGIAGMIGKDGQADAGRDEQFLAFEVQGQGEAALQFLQAFVMGGLAGTPGQQCHEAVGAGAGQPGAGGEAGSASLRAGEAADECVEALADGLEKGVADAVAEAVVELPEAIEVEQHQGVGAGRDAQHHFQATHEAAAVAQSGQQVLLEQAVAVDAQAQAVPQLEDESGPIQRLEQDIGEVQAQGVLPEVVIGAGGQQDDRQVLPGGVLEPGGEPGEAGLVAGVQTDQHQGRRRAAADEVFGGLKVGGDLQFAQALVGQGFADDLLTDGIGIQQQHGGLLQDKCIFTSVDVLAANADVDLGFHR